MKKVTSILLSLLFIISAIFTGCGKQQTIAWSAEEWNMQ